MSFGSWEDSQHAVPKLETQESQWYKPACVRKPRKANGISQLVSESLRARSSDVWRQERWMSQLKKRERICPSFTFFSTLALNGLADAHSDEGRALHPLLSQMLISSRNSLVEILRNTLLPLTWAPRAQSCLPLLMRKFLSEAWSYPRVIHRTSFCTGWLAHAILQQASNSTAAAWGLGSQLVLLLPLLPLWSLWYPVC